MHLFSVPTVILFASLVFGQGNVAPAAVDANTLGGADVAASLFSLYKSGTHPSASPTAGSTAVPVTFQTGSPTLVMATTPSATTSLEATTSTAATPAAVVSSGSSMSAMAKSSSPAGTSSKTASGLATGTAMSSPTNATKTTAASASPTKSKKNSAGQFRGVAGSVGIPLLVGVFAGL
ncbi:hypothetical protein HO173_005110 [Letharia columbiana]|uniref:Uncharacterized protein n=1 Tax=Letharia columbiana TaxID=112416 RepID=A0A8H6FXX5_9LECA|nr:uncharacterized protein HO173_005110 [Letharia columbiana]KAF6236819.1 hypothetical protein HO173_005110 [Letharia columbiana]